MVAFLDRLRKEWHVVRGAPFSFAIVSILAISVIFSGSRWFYRSKIADAGLRAEHWKSDADYWKDRATHQPTQNSDDETPTASVPVRAPGHPTRDNVTVTGKITQNGQLNQIGNGNQATINNPPHNPEAGETTYAFNGFCRRFSPGVIAGCPGEEEAFDRFMSLEQAKDWGGIVKEADAEIEKVPAWPTPYAFKGMAYLNLGRWDDGIKLLEYSDQKTSGNSDFDEIRRILSEARKTPH